jgi:two-component system sensor kinase FixL
MSQLAARQDAGDGAVKERMQEIIASVDRLNRWIAGLMEAARGEPSEVAAMDVRPVLQRAKEAVESETQTKEVQLEVEMPDQPVICLHEPVTLEHTLVAMLINAIEASPPGERVLLRLDALQRGQEPSMGSVCCISVTDRGSGLPDEDPSVIFDFSFSTKQQGMGLGLALARVGLQRQGGVVCARNNADSGATVWVELPVQEQRSDAL